MNSAFKSYNSFVCLFLPQNKKVTVTFYLTNQFSRNCELLFHNSNFSSQNCEFISHNFAFISHNSVNLSQNLSLYLAILRYFESEL